MLQKAADLRLFAFKTSHQRSLSAPPPNLLRSVRFCTFATDENHQPCLGTAAAGYLLNL